MTKLTTEQIESFERDGYLVVDNVLSEDDLAPIWKTMNAILDRVAPTDDPTRSFSDRYAEMINRDPDLFRHFEITLPLENHQITAETTLNTDPAIFGLLTHPKLLDVVESIIGGEITSAPVQHARIKPPLNKIDKTTQGNSYIGKTPWHQDMTGVIDEAIDTDMLTCWVAITDAPKERGCLCAVQGSHRKGIQHISPHCPSKEAHELENYIPARELGDADGNKTVVPLPVNRGGVVLLSAFTEHAALPNVSDEMRFSFDLRFHPTGQVTGRPAFPDFVARSRKNRDSELRSAERWAQSWQEAKENIIAGNYKGNIYNVERLEEFADSAACA